MFVETFVGIEAVRVECCTELPGSASEPLCVSWGPVWCLQALTLPSPPG